MIVVWPHLLCKLCVCLNMDDLNCSNGLKVLTNPSSSLHGVLCIAQAMMERFIQFFLSSWNYFVGYGLPITRLYTIINRMVNAISSVNLDKDVELPYWLFKLYLDLSCSRTKNVMFYLCFAFYQALKLSYR